MRYASRLIQKAQIFTRSVRANDFFQKELFFRQSQNGSRFGNNQSIKYAKNVLILNTVLLLKIVTENDKVRYGKDTVGGLNSEP
jgi:hypothetical protein